MTVYLLHLERPLSPDHTAQHYVGSADDVIERLNQHTRRPDARFMEVAKERAISWCLARIWPGGRKAERRIKNQKNAPRLCPICQGQADFEPWVDVPF